MEHKKIAGACEGLRIHAEILQHWLKCAEARAVRACMSEPQFQDMTAFIPNWLYLFFMTMLLVLLFAVPFALVLHWVPTAFGDFFILGVLNIAFAQLLVILNLVKNRIIWFLLPLVGSLKMGRFCYPSADMATYLYPKALEEAHGIGAPIDQMNEGEKDRASSCPAVCSSSPWRKPIMPARQRVPTSSLRVVATCDVSCSLPAWCPLRA